MVGLNRLLDPHKINPVIFRSPLVISDSELYIHMCSSIYYIRIGFFLSHAT